MNSCVQQESLLPDLFSSLYAELNEDQTRAMRLLHGPQNVFVTGSAGTGKSYLIRKYLKGTDRKCIPVLASTGAAAVLIGGRTFHSFFGLGILEGGPEATLQRALKDRRVVSRLRSAHAIVIDEISMLPGSVLTVAESVARAARAENRPWGGLKVIAVGDFAQLPPIETQSRKKDWAFLHSVWEESEFVCAPLNQMMRSAEDPRFCEALADVRQGQVTERVRSLLEGCSETFDGEEFQGSILFARKADVDKVNHDRLNALPGDPQVFATEYSGADTYRKMLIRNAPIAENIALKKNAFVMLRQNDPKGRWVNGSLGFVRGFGEDGLVVELLNGREVEIAKASFGFLDADGREVASARNFPLSLAWAVTIHKSQGATLDSALVTLNNLWEPGQAYVALSRVKSASGLRVNSWNERSIFADPDVLNFHQSMNLF